MIYIYANKPKKIYNNFTSYKNVETGWKNNEEHIK